MAVEKCPNVNNIGGDGCNGRHVGDGDSSSDGDGVGLVAIVLTMAMLLVVMVILRGFVVVQMVFVVL